MQFEIQQVKKTIIDKKDKGTTTQYESKGRSTSGEVVTIKEEGDTSFKKGDVIELKKLTSQKTIAVKDKGGKDA